MLVSEILAAKSRPLITATVDTTIPDAMELLLTNKISCLPVLSSGRLVGIVSDKDIFALAHREPDTFRGRKVWDVMTETVMTALSTDEIYQVAAIMTRYRFRHMPIVEDDQVIGLVSIGDIVKAQLDSMAEENTQLRKYIAGEYPG
jgi:CBS domain-containing protein